MCLQEAQKYFVFNLNSMYHEFSKLFDSQDLIAHGSHLIFVKSCQLLVCVLMVKMSPNFNKICFMPYSTTLSIKQTPPPAVKDREGAGRSRVGMTVVNDSMVFLKASLR